MEKTIEELRKHVYYFELGSAAEGKIGANAEKKAGFFELKARVESGEFHVAAKTNVVGSCIDGRPGCDELLPNGAGGALLYVAAERLVGGNSESLIDTEKRVLENLKRNNSEVRVHADDHARGEMSGCGACDRMLQIFDILALRPDSVREIVRELGVEVDDQTHDLIIAGAREENSFASGAELFATAYDILGEDRVDQLHGDHNEMLVVVNKNPNTTLDRAELAAEFGDKFQVFNVDAWSFENSARLLSDDSNKQRQLAAAMTYYNVATALVLCDVSMNAIELS